MAPKKRNISKSKTNEKTPKKPKTETKPKKNETKEETISSINEVSDNENNGLRRSKRVSIVKKPIENKSKYFVDSEDDGIESDESIANDDDFKPEVKVKESIVNPKKALKIESDSSSDGEEDWEEVVNNDNQELDDYKPDIPSEGVQITLNESEVKKKKKCADINDLIRQRINRHLKEMHSNKHKTSLLLLISRAFYLNNCVNNDLIQSISLSITINEKTLKGPKKLSLDFLKKSIDWFKDNFKLKFSKKQTNEWMSQSLIRCLGERVAQNGCELNLTFLSLFRSINKKYITRLCYALNPIDLKSVDLILSQKQKETMNSSKKKSSKDKKSPKVSKPKKRKVVSSDSESESIEENVKTFDEKVLDVWLEIFVESERKWISLDLSNHLVDKPIDIASKSLPQLSYVIAIDSDGYMREVTQRYTTDWMSPSMKKRRIDENWWTQTLEPFQRKNKSLAEKAEDSEFEEKISSTPLPTKISEFKNHPLYVLKKDLLKFQGIYPSDAPPLGFIRGEPIYARECVQLLRSRETWLRFARTVRVGETAYKLVKSRPKWDKYSKTWKRDLPLELFGEWQTEPYDPPEAKDGKVPRNGYGNVDLFHESMIPKGCVHLRLPGLIRIANKLKIDCSPAIVGFDNNNGGLGSHPVMDGFIVCKEFEEVLIAAWEEEQVNAAKREHEKKEKRVYDNWRKLIKGLLIREKVKKKYKTESEDDNEDTDIESDN